MKLPVTLFLLLILNHNTITGVQARIHSPSHDEVGNIPQHQKNYNSKYSQKPLLFDRDRDLASSTSNSNSKRVSEPSTSTDVDDDVSTISNANSGLGTEGETEMNMVEKCSIVSKCMYCSTWEQLSITEDDYTTDDEDGEYTGRMQGCDQTGRREKLECIRIPDIELSTRSPRTQETYFKYQSCQRTEWDESNAVIKLQIFCLFLAYFSLTSVKREKLVSASLFDQRIYNRRRTIPSAPATRCNDNGQHFSEVSQIELKECGSNGSLGTTTNNIALSSDGSFDQSAESSVDKLENKL